MIESVTREYEEMYAPYKPLDGAGRVSRTGLLDVKAAYDLLGERLKAQASSSSSSSGCSAGYPVMILFAAAFMRLIGKKHRVI